eukprot:jgi/Botrbrau1/18712/Bobra.0386s0037.1
MALASMTGQAAFSRLGDPCCSQPHAYPRLTSLPSPRTGNERDSRPNRGRFQIQASTAKQLVTCRRCKLQFLREDNRADACRYHPSLYTGGEVTKAVGFLREGQGREKWVDARLGRSGLIRFWDCCGNEEEGAPGCCIAPHVTYDDASLEAA